MIIKMSKVEERILIQAAREKQIVTNIRNSIRLSADFFSVENMQARRLWHDILKILKGKTFSRIPYLTKLSFRIEKKRKFARPTNAKGMLTTKPALQKLLK